MQLGFFDYYQSWFLNIVKFLLENNELTFIHISSWKMNSTKMKENAVWRNVPS